MGEKLEESKKMLKMTYEQAVDYLLDKYGKVEYDYFSEKSYKRFLNGEIKGMSKNNKLSRTNDGLYCHHIDELNYVMLSNRDFIKFHKYPFELQRADRLVYCDLVEHSILHTLISRKATLMQGQGGYWNFIRPTIDEWYIQKKVPKPEWMKNCYKKAFLSKEDAEEFLKISDKLTKKTAIY